MNIYLHIYEEKYRCIIYEEVFKCIIYEEVFKCIVYEEGLDLYKMKN